MPAEDKFIRKDGQHDHSVRSTREVAGGKITYHGRPRQGTSEGITSTLVYSDEGPSARSAGSKTRKATSYSFRTSGHNQPVLIMILTLPLLWCLYALLSPYVAGKCAAQSVTPGNCSAATFAAVLPSNAVIERVDYVAYANFLVIRPGPMLRSPL